MKRLIIVAAMAILMTGYSISPSLPTIAYAANSDNSASTFLMQAIEVQAIPTNSVVLINGSKAAVEAYNINGNNYFKLRDLASALNGSPKQFEVTWDGVANAINILSSHAYTPVGGELTGSVNAEKVQAVLTTTKVNLDGKEVLITAYNINGFNYFKLRDVGRAIDFSVTWDSVTNAIAVDTSGSYYEQMDNAAYMPEIKRENFVRGIDNPYMPMTVGTTFVFSGNSEDGIERNEVYVTSEKKMIMGVECTVVLDQVWVDGDLEEKTYDWYAQDIEGNVWYFGEDSQEIDEGKVVSTAGSWIAGVDGALPGIVMKADPKVGDAYRQEYYAGEAEDMASVVSLNEVLDLSYGKFENVLKTKEWTPLEKGVAENKYYAMGIGLIKETVIEGGTGMLELIEIKTE